MILNITDIAIIIKIKTKVIITIIVNIKNINSSKTVLSLLSFGSK